MRITVSVEGRARKASVPYAGADSVIVDGVNCPHCNEPLVVQAGMPRVDHNTYRANAWCVACRDRIGEMVVTVSTIFGIEEDERVLNGRARVY